MAWADARDQLATHLAAVEATTGGKTFSGGVDQFPVAVMSDTPRFVMELPSTDEPERIGGWRNTEYVLPVGLFVLDEELEQAARILDAFREAIFDKFDGSVALENNAAILRGPRVLPADEVLFAGLQYPHTTFQFRIRVGEAKTIGA
jgi:hypothetical protein